MHIDFDGRPHSLTGDLHQSKLTEGQDGVASLVARHLGTHYVIQLLAVVGFLHVDEVNDDDAAHIAQTELAGDFLGGFDIDLEGSVFLTGARFDMVATVYINDVHCFSMLDVEVHSRADGDDASESTTNVAQDSELFENRGLEFIVFHYVGLLGSHRGDVFSDLVVYGFVVDIDGVEIVG